MFVWIGVVILFLVVVLRKVREALKYFGIRNIELLNTF